jgi:hypothetical protein
MSTCRRFGVRSRGSSSRHLGGVRRGHSARGLWLGRPRAGPGIHLRSARDGRRRAPRQVDHRQAERAAVLRTQAGKGTLGSRRAGLQAVGTAPHGAVAPGHHEGGAGRQAHEPAAHRLRPPTLLAVAPKKPPPAGSPAAIEASTINPYGSRSPRSTRRNPSRRLTAEQRNRPAIESERPRAAGYISECSLERRVGSVPSGATLAL